MKVVHLPQSLLYDSHKPLVALVDMQREFVSDGRPSYIESARDAVNNAVALVQFARLKRLPVAHFRFLKAEHEFNSVSEYSHWIDDLKPRSNDYVYSRSQPSCFSNSAFSEFIGSIDHARIIVAGLGSEQSCLATIVDAYHRNCEMIFATDCSASRALAQWTEAETHAAVVNVAASFCLTVDLPQLRALFSPKEQRGFQG